MRHCAQIVLGVFEIGLHYVVLVGLLGIQIRLAGTWSDLLDSASQVQGFQACASTPSFLWKFRVSFIGYSAVR